MIESQHSLEAARAEQHTQSLAFSRLDREVLNATQPQRLLLVPALLDAKFRLDSAEQEQQQAKVCGTSYSCH